MTAIAIERERRWGRKAASAVKEDPRLTVARKRLQSCPKHPCVAIA